MNEVQFVSDNFQNNIPPDVEEFGKRKYKPIQHKQLLMKIPSKSINESTIIDTKNQLGPMLEANEFINEEKYCNDVISWLYLNILLKMETKTLSFQKQKTFCEIGVLGKNFFTFFVLFLVWWEGGIKKHFHLWTKRSAKLLHQNSWLLHSFYYYLLEFNFFCFINEAQFGLETFKIDTPLVERNRDRIQERCLLKKLLSIRRKINESTTFNKKNELHATKFINEEKNCNDVIMFLHFFRDSIY